MSVLPKWAKGESGRWTCDDLSEMAFSAKAKWLVTPRTSYWFDVPAFDIWLSEQPDSDGKQMLLRKRAEAKAAATIWEMIACLQVLASNQEHVPAARRAQRKGPRAARRPRLGEWLDAQLRKEPNQSAKELWRRLPEEKTGSDLYVIDGGGGVVELDENGAASKALAFGGFESQVSDARKRAKNRR